MGRIVASLGALALAAIASAAAAPAAAAPAAAEQTIPGPHVGQPAPSFRLTTVDGRTVTLASYRARTLVLNVWGSWCPPCRIEQPDLVAEAKADAPSVAFLGIDTTESAGTVRAFSAAKGVPYPQVATTPASAFAHDYAITNYPTTIVIDPEGIVRAVHSDNLLPRAQLHAFVAAARSGRSATLVSAEQQRLDALLDPAHFTLTGDAAAVRGGVTAALRAIADADDQLDATMTDAARDHDYVRTKEEEQALRLRAIDALASVASGDTDRALLARVRGDAALAAGDLARADARYGEALTIVPADDDALGGRAIVASRLGDDKRALAYDRQIAEALPTYSAWVAVGRAAGRSGDAAAAEAAFAQARSLAEATAAAKPGDAPALRAVAWTNLYDGRTEAALGNKDAARAAFDRALAAASQLPATDARYEMYVEQAQEGRMSLVLGDGGPQTALTLAPWTGPTLPGSVPNTVKYRVAVTGRAGTQVMLRAGGLPKSWIASFCTDKICSPFRVPVTLPASGVKIVELQIVPPDAAVKLHPTVSVEIVGAPATRATAVVAAG